MASHRGSGPVKLSKGGSYPERGKKTPVLLDAARLLGKLHFSLWPRCHNSFTPKLCTISTFRSLRPPSSTASSCVTTPRRNFSETFKYLHHSSSNHTPTQR